MSNPKFYDLMIDTETLGPPPDGALLSIGAIFFDLHTGTLGPEFNAVIHLGSAVADGGVMDPGTVLWWFGQSDAARHAVRFGGRHIHQVLDDFSAWIAEHCRHEDVRPWGNGASFDLTIINSAYKRAGRRAPWHFTNERCFRTLRNQYPSVVYDPNEKGEGAHNALEDARFQAKHLFKIKNRNKQGA